MKSKLFITACGLFLVLFTANGYALTQPELDSLAHDSLVSTFETLDALENSDALLEIAAALFPASTGLSTVIEINSRDTGPEEKADELARTASLDCDTWLEIALIAFVLSFFIPGIPYSWLFLIWLLCYAGII